MSLERAQPAAPPHQGRGGASPEGRERGGGTAPATTGSGPGLVSGDFTQVVAQGFGDQANAYIHSMILFKKQLFAGTSRHSMALLRLFPPPEPPPMDPWPVRAPDSVEDLDMHGQIWRGTDRGGTWDLAYRSPGIRGKNGRRIPRDLGYRGMAVFQGRSDDAPALYVGAISTVLRGTAARVLRSADGEHFRVVGPPGLGNPRVSSFRAMTVFDGHLFVPPAGEGITLNSNRASVVMRSPDPAAGAWSEACEPGFGDPTNTGIFEMAVFGDHLYAGTFNASHGYQVWKTPATGDRPCRWVKVLDCGAHRGPSNEIAMSMCAFKDALYIGSAVQNGGYDRVNRVGPAASELVRLRADDSWDLLVGEPRHTPDGDKAPLSGIDPGFDNIFAGYFWRMAVHDGWLYLSTFDWSIFLHYAGRPSPAARRLVDEYGLDRVAGRGGGFELWRTQDGVVWIPVTLDGLGNPYNYGARTLVSTPHGLALGTANPFAPEAPVRSASGWQYTANPDGGAEVWLGRTPAPARRAARRRLRDEALVTGGTGFIGTTLVNRLLSQVRSVRVLAVPGTADALGAMPEVRVIDGDLADPDALRRAVDGVDVVFHLAALLPGADPLDMHAVNVEGTRALLHAAMRGEVRRFVLMSSTAVYANAFRPDTWPLTEASDVGPTGPASILAYGWSKVAAERLVRTATADGPMDHVILRATQCYGPGSRRASELIRSISTPYPASTNHVMQFVHVTDLAEMAAELGLRGPAGETFNLASPDAISLTAAQKLMACFTGRQSFREGQGAAIERYRYPFDMAKARAQGVIGAVSIRAGLIELATVSPMTPATRDRWVPIAPDAQHLYRGLRRPLLAGGRRG